MKLTLNVKRFLEHYPTVSIDSLPSKVGGGGVVEDDLKLLHLVHHQRYCPVTHKGEIPLDKCNM
jgi:hypothetical protein